MNMKIGATTKREITVGLAEDVYRAGGSLLWEESNNCYPESEYADTEFGALLWREVKNLVKKARLTEAEVEVFDGYLRGFDDAMIADIRKCTESTIRDHRASAINKLRALPEVGLLTVLVESQGFDAVARYSKTLDKRK